MTAALVLLCGAAPACAADGLPAVSSGHRPGPDALYLPPADAPAFRVTLNTLKDPNRTAFTIALGSSAAAVPWPHGAGVSSPAALFLTVHGSTAELLDAATGQARQPAPTASVDLTRRQIDVQVPHAAWDPGQGTVRMTIGVGLWNPSAGT